MSSSSEALRCYRRSHPRLAVFSPRCRWPLKVVLVGLCCRRSSSACAITAVGSAFLCSPSCSPRHPQRIAGPPSPISSPKQADSSIADLVAGEFSWLSVCVTSSDSPSSFDPPSPCRLYAAEVPCRRHHSSPSPVFVRPSLQLSPGHFEPRIVFPSLSPTPCFPLSSPSALAPPSQARELIFVAAISSPPLSSHRHPCRSASTQVFLSSLGVHFLPVVTAASPSCVN